MSEKQVIYDIILRAGPISRKDISTKYGKRPATVTRITNKLLEQNLVCSRGKDILPKGRAKELLSVNPEAFYVLGIHVVSGGVRGAVVASGGKVVSCSEMALQWGGDREVFLEALREAVRKILISANKDGISISGIGLALPGEVDHNAGRLVQAAVILPGLTEVPCREYLENCFKLPAAVDHDA
ncbi:MAG: hypothetical protein PHV82_06470, partial [Victivallaceae bacterium]|nr:hypothetical protein [Victivallaceae bacterium]